MSGRRFCYDRTLMTSTLPMMVTSTTSVTVLLFRKSVSTLVVEYVGQRDVDVSNLHDVDFDLLDVRRDNCGYQASRAARLVVRVRLSRSWTSGKHTASHHDDRAGRGSKKTLHLVPPFGHRLTCR